MSSREVFVYYANYDSLMCGFNLSVCRVNGMPVLCRVPESLVAQKKQYQETTKQHIFLDIF